MTQSSIKLLVALFFLWPRLGTAVPTVLGIPVALDEVGTIKSGFDLIVEAYPLDLASGSTTSQPARVKAVTETLRAILTAARSGDSANFSNSSLDARASASQFTLLANLVKTLPNLAVSRGFDIGTQVLATAVFPSGNEGIVAVLAETGTNKFKQNLALSFEPIPQAITYSLKEGKRTDGGSKADTNLIVSVRLTGNPEAPRGGDVVLRTAEAYACADERHEDAFSRRFRRSIGSIVDGYLTARESGGRGNMAEKQFTLKGLQRIRASNTEYRRPPVALRTDFVFPLAEHLFMVVICPRGGDGLTTGYVVERPEGGFRILNFGFSSKLDELLKIPGVKKQLIAYARKHKEQH